MIISNYTFNKTAKTITFNDFTSIELSRIRLINNETSGGTTIYQFNKTGKTGSVSGNVLTLVYDTSAMSNSDKLAITYDVDDRDSFDKQIVNISTLPFTDKGKNAARIEGFTEEFMWDASADGSTLTLDAANYSWASLAISNNASATITLQSSNDPYSDIPHWYTNPLNGASSTLANWNQGIAATGLYHGPIMGRYVRLSITGVSGTAYGVLELFTQPRTFHSIGVTATQTGVWRTNLNSSIGTQTNITVGTTSVTAIAANSARKDLILRNNGATNLFIQWSGATATTAAMKLTPSDPPMKFTQNMITNAITVIGDAAGGSLSVTELV